MLAVRLGTAGLLDVNGTFFSDVVVFLIMLWVLWKYVYPAIVKAATARQKLISEQLEGAEKARQTAEQNLQQIEQRLADARAQAQEIIDGATRSAEQIRQELRDKGAEEARRMTELAEKETAVEKQKALDAVRAEVADLVVTATERVLGESLDGDGHRKLIDRAIAEVTGGKRSS